MEIYCRFFDERVVCKYVCTAGIKMETAEFGTKMRLTSPFSNNKEFMIGVLFIYWRICTSQPVPLNGIYHISCHYCNRLILIVLISN